jgi:hypothetical protein
MLPLVGELAGDANDTTGAGRRIVRPTYHQEVNISTAQPSQKPTVKREGR